jgi:hypothetical protein
MDLLAACASNADHLPANRPGKRVAAAPGVVYEQRDGDLLGEDFSLAQKDNLYRCLDKLLVHQLGVPTLLPRYWKPLNASAS